MPGGGQLSSSHDDGGVKEKVCLHPSSKAGTDGLFFFFFSFFSFNEMRFNWYAYADISIPNTNFDIIGQFEFGDSDGIKGSDVIAGVQYVVPLSAGELSFRGGYRVIDLEFTELAKSSPDNEMSYIFADGWFLGTQFRF